MKVRIVISGRGYQAASSIPDELELPDAALLDDALARIEELLPEGANLPASCLVALSGDHLGTAADHENRQLADRDELVLIAPVAGG